MNKTSTTCSCCGKPLTDPISVETGMGPVCRITQKQKELSEKTGNLFTNRSEYDYTLRGGILAIEDRGGMKSVTNDIENVLEDIRRAENVSFSRHLIIYKDSMGIWDGIRLVSGRVVFYSINERDFYAARAKAFVLATTIKKPSLT